MTLIMTHVSQRRIFQSGDFRLTHARTGNPLDYWAQKQIIVQRITWTSLVGFCGIAHTGHEFVPEWIVEQLRALPQDAQFDEFVCRLKSAETWLARSSPRFRAITFSVAGFVDFKPTFVLISNFEAIGRPPRPFPPTFSSTLEVTRFRPKNEQLFLSGRPGAVSPNDRHRLLGVFRKTPPPERGYDELAYANRTASTRDSSVGAACFTAHVTVLGDYGGTVHDWPADRDYLPAFVDIRGMILPRLRRGIDEHGQPKPLQIGAVFGASAIESAEYYRIALREKPSDPGILTNFGTWLKERGDIEEAENAYHKAISANDLFANAHGNLAVLLDNRGEFDAAERSYRRAVELDDEAAIYAANLAFFLWRRRGDVATGTQLLAAAIGRQRDAFTVGRLAFFTDTAIKDVDEARRLCLEALALAPDDSWINARYADHLRRTGDSDGARERFERAAKDERPDDFVLLTYASFLATHREYHQAIDVLRRALNLRPRNPSALAMLAAARTLAEGLIPDAERMYRQVLEWDSAHPIAILNLAQLLLRRRADSEEARRLLHALDSTEMSPDMGLEQQFYAVAYGVPGFDGGPAEIQRLLDLGVDVPLWDLSEDLLAARSAANPHADLLARVVTHDPAG